MKYVFGILCLVPFFALFAVDDLQNYRARFFRTFLDQRPIVIVIPSYNNEKWFENNLSSVLHQNYQNYRILYVNDCSTDGMPSLVEKYLQDQNIDRRILSFDPVSTTIEEITKEFAKEVNRESHFFTLIHNKKRVGALANLYRMIHSCQEEEIVATVDGDDWLAHTEVLSKLNKMYQDSNVWYTHGTIKEYPWGHVAWSERIPQHVLDAKTYRTFKCPSHLRTFYTWLFKKIKLEDFLYSGEFFSVTWDMAIMYPIAEMAGEHHAFSSDVLYIYNMHNEIGDSYIHTKLQNDLDAYIRSMSPYKPLMKKS